MRVPSTVSTLARSTRRWRCFGLYGTGRIGDRAAALVAVVEEVRTSLLVRGFIRRRFRDEKSVASSTEKNDFGDWAWSIPRTALYVVMDIAKQSGGTVQRRTIWKHDNKLNGAEPGAVSHEKRSEILA